MTYYGEKATATFVPYKATSKTPLEGLISEVTDTCIFSSENMENMPPESWMWFRMNFTSGVFSSKTLVFRYYMLAREFLFLPAGEFLES